MTKSLLFGANQIFESTEPVRSILNLRVKLSVSQMVIVFAFVEIFAKYFPSGVKSIE